MLPVVLVVMMVLFMTMRLSPDLRMARFAMMRVGIPVLERLELMQHLVAVERANVARLHGRQSTHRPGEMHEVRLDGVRQRMHADLLGEPVALAGVAGAARRDDVRP